MENKQFICIDGSHLFASIQKIKNKHRHLADRKVKLDRLTKSLTSVWHRSNSITVRVIYYFKKRDPRIDTMLDIPSADIPNARLFFEIKECGEPIKAIPETEVAKLSPKYQDCYQRAEKGLDIKLTCDALLWVANQKATNIIFLANDSDYIPLFNAIKDLGGSVYLTALDSTQNINKKLAESCDRYIALDNDLERIFGIEKGQQVLLGSKLLSNI